MSIPMKAIKRRKSLPWKDFDDSELSEIMEAIESFRDAMRTLDSYDIDIDAIEIAYEAISDELDRRDAAEVDAMYRQYEGAVL